MMRQLEEGKDGGCWAVLFSVKSDMKLQMAKISCGSRRGKRALCTPPGTNYENG